MRSILSPNRGNGHESRAGAADLERRERPRQIVVYRDGKFLVALGTNQARPDVAEHYVDPNLLRTGFRGSVPGAPEPATFSDRHRVFALMLACSAIELPIRELAETGSEEPGFVTDPASPAGAVGNANPRLRSVRSHSP